MTKKSILELIQRRCKSIDDTGHFNLLYIQGYCDQVWQEFVANMNADPAIDKSFYSKEYEVAGISGDATDGYYIDLPEEIINLPRAGSGVTSIRQGGTFSNYFAPVTEDVFKHVLTQEVYRQGDDVYFFLGYDKINFGGGGVLAIVAEDIIMKLVIPFSKYDLSEEIPFPVIKEPQFVDVVVERVIGTPAPDLYNNNSDE